MTRREAIEIVKTKRGQGLLLQDIAKEMGFPYKAYYTWITQAKGDKSTLDIDIHARRGRLAKLSKPYVREIELQPAQQESKLICLIGSAHEISIAIKALI